jgi:hypothetical protein
MRWTWNYLGKTTTLYDNNTIVHVPSDTCCVPSTVVDTAGAECCRLFVVREADTGMPPNENVLEDRVQQSAGRVWLFNYLDSRIIRLTFSIVGDKPNSIGAEELVVAKRILCKLFNPQPTAPDGALTF